MKIKINLPGELRTRIKNFLADLDGAVKCAPENRAMLSDEISRLEGEAARLTDEITGLKLAAADNDSAAVALNTKTTRHAQITERLAGLRQDLANLRPVTLAGAADVISDVTRFYVNNLPDAIADFLADSGVCPTRSRALFAVKQFDCVIVLHSLRNWSVGINADLASPANIIRLKSVLERALRGQANLGADLPQPSTEATQ